MTRFSWASMTAAERGVFIRHHTKSKKPLSHEKLCSLFNLTDKGLAAILDGADWDISHAPSTTEGER